MIIQRLSLALLLGLCSVLPAQADDSDKRACEMYKERLKKYQREGVMGYNLLTGRTEKMDARQAREVIEDTRENINIFCNASGVVR